MIKQCTDLLTSNHKLVFKRPSIQNNYSLLEHHCNYPAGTHITHYYIYRYDAHIKYMYMYTIICSLASRAYSQLWLLNVVVHV